MTDPKLRTDLPCGCWRAVVARKVPAFVDAPGTPEHGTPKIGPGGEILCEEHEEIEESYCPKHSGVIIERQHAAAAALAAGRQEEAMALMAGVSPFPMLGSGEDDSGE